MQFTKPKPSKVPSIIDPDLEPNPVLTGIKVGISDKICIDVQADACNAMNDMCALLKNSPEGPPAFCTESSKMCQNPEIASLAKQITVQGKFCLNFKASGDICTTAAKLCAPGSAAADSAVCKKIIPLCPQ